LSATVGLNWVIELWCTDRDCEITEHLFYHCP